jgi:protein-L-isoaspartate(D-aspartate) O-methyltransferase
MTRTPQQGRFPLPLESLHGAARPQGRELLRPQRHVQLAAADAARAAAPSGIGLDSGAVRTRMVERLHAGGVRHEAVLQAFARVQRHCFVDSALATQAYEDTSLPIGHGQTISKPSVVARMLELLFEGALARERGHLGRVLEIGTGCGYQAALLTQLARDVVSIERIAPLAERAAEHLHAQGLAGPRLHLLHADGRAGYAPRAPYDTLIAAAGGDALPAAWLAQVAVGGRLVAPMVDAALGTQRLLVMDRSAGGWSRQEFDAVHFVPLKSGTE